jgi:hypothetical protein
VISADLLFLIYLKKLVMADITGKFEKLKEADLFSTKLTAEKKQKTFIGVFFTVIMVASLIAYGLSSVIKATNTPYVWDVKEFKNS